MNAEGGPGAMLWRGAALIAIAAIAQFPAAAVAETSEGISARVTLDNDQFNFWEGPGERPDFGYTHGTEITLRVPHAGHRIARHLPRTVLGTRDPGGEAALEFRIRQNIYSPWRYPPDRPYAGWLEAAVGVSRADPRALREIFVHAGVTGPPSQAGAIQSAIHRRFFHEKQPPDWSRQLPFEPGVGIETGAGWMLRSSDRGEFPGWGARMGFLTRARAGTYAIDLRLGVPAAVGWAPPGAWDGGARRPHGPSLYARIHPRLDFIARDEFLDGPLFRPGPGPGARRLVGESEVALGTGWGHVGMEWAVMRRSIEFDHQPTPHTYGSLMIRWLP